MLWLKTIQCWIDESWQGLSGETLRSDIAGEIAGQYGPDDMVIAGVFERQQSQFPAQYKLPNTTNVNSSSYNRSQPTLAHSSKRSEARKPQVKSNSLTLQVNPMSIVINNAGLVILQSFLKHYLNRLELLTEEGDFVNEQAHHDAVHFIQYLVSGLMATEEQHLPLNKLMCGIDINDA